MKSTKRDTNFLIRGCFLVLLCQSTCRTSSGSDAPLPQRDRTAKERHRVDIYVNPQKDRELVVVDQNLSKNVVNVTKKKLPQHRDHLWKRRRRRLEKKEPGFIRFIKKIGRGIKKGFQKLGEFVLNLFS